MRLLRTTAFLGAATAVLLAAAPSAAVAAPDDLTTLKAAVSARIDLRLAALSKDTAAITAAKHLTDGDKSTLTSLISADTTAMNSLKTKVAGETTAAGVKADATSMVNDYRIFILVGPKVRLTIAGDGEAAAITKLQTVHDKLADLVAKAKAAGKDTTAAEQDLADMAASITKAQGSLSGQVAAVLAIQPGPDGAGIRAKVATVRAGIGTTRASLKTAVADAKKVTAFLKSVK
jgi:phosphotransferase system HPr-like phosphotransfer protein